jgi:hypothetical protein
VQDKPSIQLRALPKVEEEEEEEEEEGPTRW